MNEELQRKVSREDILGMQNYLLEQPNSIVGDSDLCPVKHTFTDGIYVREIFIPAGMFIVGKIHKHSHPNFLMSGIVRMITEFESKEISGPLSMISEAGTKRALYSVTDLIWITVHHNPNDIQDLQKLEDLVIAPSYEAYEQFKFEQLKEKLS